MKATKTWVLIVLLLITAINVYAWPIPDTGQTKCYNNTVEIPCPAPGEAFYGQDGNYTINPPAYTKLDSTGNVLADGAASWVMVRDNVTGLIWENKTNDGTIHDGSKTFTWCDTNPATNGGDPGTCGAGTGDAATDTEAFIKALNDANFGGFSDWRMPTPKELTTIVDRRSVNPAINAAWFPNTEWDNYWSSSSHAYYGSSSACCVAFSPGVLAPCGKIFAYAARAVRGEQSEYHYVDNGDGTVTDTATGLMWQQETATGMDWQPSLDYAEALTLAGYDDWRLPNIVELQSLTDHRRYNPAIDTMAFPETLSSYYRSSSTNPNTNPITNTWSLDFARGGDRDTGKRNEYYAVRTVRGGQNRSAGSLVISAPTQAARWGIGIQKTIAWDTAGLVGNVKISLSRQGGKTGTFETIIESTENDGSFDWTVTGPVSVNCVLKIEPVDDSSKATSQGLFTILADSVLINGGDANTNMTSVTLTLSWSDSASGDAQMSFSNDGIIWSEWQAYATSASWSLSTGDGLKTVYARVKDTLGNVSANSTDTITLDTRTPITTASPVGGTYAAAQNVILSADETAMIYYTTDGSAPTTASTIYTGPIAIPSSATMILKFFAKDPAGNMEAVKTETYTFDTTGPTGSVVINGGASITNNSQVTLTLSATDVSGVTQMQFSNDNSTWTAPEEYTTAKPWQLTAGDGVKTVYVKFKDALGTWSVAYTYTITLDTSPPNGTIVINLNATYTISTSVTLTLSATDATGVVQMQFSNDNTDWSTPETYATTKPWSILSGDGTKTVYVKFKDAVGNLSGAYSDTITLDTVPPTGSIIIADGATYATSTSVSLTLSATDITSGVAQMSFSNDDVTWSNWESYATSKTWTLANGDGNKTVYVRYKDNAGNVSENITGSITLDLTAPTAAVNALAAYQTTLTFPISWTGNDAASGILNYDVQYRDGASGTWTDWKTAVIVTSATFTGLDGHTYYFRARARDNAGYLGVFAISDTQTTVDLTPPPPAVLIINGGALSCTSMNVILSISATDAVQMSFSNDGIIWSEWQAYAATASWSLVAGDGTKTVYVRVMDAAGNISVVGSICIHLDAAAGTQFGFTINDGAVSV